MIDNETRLKLLAARRRKTGQGMWNAIPREAKVRGAKKARQQDRIRALGEEG